MGELKQVVSSINKNKALLQKQISENNTLAGTVGSLYNMVIRSSDIGSVSLLIDAYEDWVDQNETQIV